MGVEKWTLRHVGVSVANMDKAVDYYKSLGLVVSETPAHVLDSKQFTDLKTYGKTDAPPWKINIKMVNIGPLTLELTESLEGNNINGEYLKKVGEGANHIAYVVDDLAAEVEEMKAKDVPIMYYATGAYAYFDTRKVGGVIIELMQNRNLKK